MPKSQYSSGGRGFKPCGKCPHPAKCRKNGKCSKRKASK